jgi:predicted nucleotidyltransferase
MRVTQQQQANIKKALTELCGTDSTIILFGSRTRNDEKGGDIDLMVEVPNEVDRPAQLIAKIAVRVMRIMNGRKTDILLSAPNLPRYPIHDIAKAQGILL